MAWKAEKKPFKNLRGKWRDDLSQLSYGPFSGLKTCSNERHRSLYHRALQPCTTIPWLDRARSQTTCMAFQCAWKKQPAKVDHFALVNYDSEILMLHLCEKIKLGDKTSFCRSSHTIIHTIMLQLVTECAIPSLPIHYSCEVKLFTILNPFVRIAHSWYSNYHEIVQWFNCAVVYRHED